MEVSKMKASVNTNTGYQLNTFPGTLSQVGLETDSTSTLYEKSEKSGKIAQEIHDSHPTHHIRGEIPLESVIISSTIACKNSQQQIERIVAAFNEGVDTSRVYQVDPVCVSFKMEIFSHYSVTYCY